MTNCWLFVVFWFLIGSSLFILFFCTFINLFEFLRVIFKTYRTNSFFRFVIFKIFKAILSNLYLVVNLLIIKFKEISGIFITVVIQHVFIALYLVMICYKFLQFIWPFWILKSFIYIAWRLQFLRIIFSHFIKKKIYYYC